jgi:hypothetical protein
MKIRIIRSCFVRGEHIEAGTEVDVELADANNLIASGKGVSIGGDPSIENREAAAESRDPQPAEKPGKSKA